MNMNKLVWHQY